MTDRKPVLRTTTYLLALAALIGSVAWGCGSPSAISVLNFMNRTTSNPSISFPRGGGTRPPTTTPPTTPTINSTCDLSAARKSLSMLLKNESLQNAAYSITLLASAGSGGFVCDAELGNYTAAGYLSVPLGAGNTYQIGCDVVTLSTANGFRGGTALLARTITGSIAPNLSGTPAGAPAAGAPLNGTTAIPVPEVIVLGDGNALFICQANNPCTQGGFTYTNALNVQIDDIFASRTQGTLCREGAGERPEWRLLNPSSADTSARAFEYVAGASVTVTVLDRVFNPSANQNKVVWQVIGPTPGLTTIHGEAR